MTTLFSLISAVTPIILTRPDGADMQVAAVHFSRATGELRLSWKAPYINERMWFNDVALGPQMAVPAEQVIHAWAVAVIGSLPYTTAETKASDVYRPEWFMSIMATSSTDLDSLVQDGVRLCAM